jgi:glycosyltransferase involved in cell wall biosynthesis
LFASADAQTLADLAPVRDQAIRLDPALLKSDLAAHLSMLDQVRRRAGEFDVIHFHTDMLQFPLFEPLAAKTLTTLHGRLDLKDLPEVYRRWRRFPLVSISDDQRKPMLFANWAGTVHHGLDADLYRPSLAGAGYLAFLGRISPEKGPDRAIDIAARAGLPLKMAAKVDGQDRAYFHDEIEPLIKASPQVEFVGEIGDAQKSSFLGGAEALLFPIAWPEPFGLVMIEAMACGAPVIAFDHGSVREVVEDGVTGFIVRSPQEAAEAVVRARRLDRMEIRRRFEVRFSASAMAGRYLDLYRRMIGGDRPAHPLAVTA